jgi:hypothetical protein
MNNWIWKFKKIYNNKKDKGREEKGKKGQRKDLCRNLPRYGQNMYTEDYKRMTLKSYLSDTIFMI